MSAQALDSVDVNARQAEVLGELEHAYPSGLTAGELAELLGRQANCIARRCRDLVTLGLVVEAGTRVGPFGRPQIVWRLNGRR